MTFKSTSISFIIAISIIALLHIFLGISLWWLVFPGAVYLALNIYGTAIIRSNFYAQPYCHADVSEKQIALSFDDGPNQEYTPQVLSTLGNTTRRQLFLLSEKTFKATKTF